MLLVLVDSGYCGASWSEANRGTVSEERPVNCIMMNLQKLGPIRAQWNVDSIS